MARKRHIKKWAKGAKKNMVPYRDARGKGSKKLCRRWKAMKRYWNYSNRADKKRYEIAKSLLELVNSEENGLSEDEITEITELANRDIAYYERKLEYKRRIEATKTTFRKLKNVFKDVTTWDEVKDNFELGVAAND